MQLFLFLLDACLINLCYIIAFLIRYKANIPESSILPYKNSSLILTLIYLCTFVSFSVYKKMFRSSWELFKKIFYGMFTGTFLYIAFIYVVREKLAAFPTSVFVISFFIGILVIFKVNQIFLKAFKRIRKRIVILGNGFVDDIIEKKSDVKRVHNSQINELFDYDNIDEIVISEKIVDADEFNLLFYLSKKLKCEILFSPLIYMELLPHKINETSTVELSTFIGRKSDLDEFLIRIFDVICGFLLLIFTLPLMLILGILISVTSPGPVIYKQKRVGKDGEIFVLYKLRTMINEAEQMVGFKPAEEDDIRVTKIGKLLRRTRLDELPQLYNILKGDMSLVGPRPENLYRVNKHKALRGLRLSVRPGLTGLAQIRSYYDLHPSQKIRYDYLYIQKKSLLLNIYILVKTVFVVFAKKGQ